MKGLTKTNTSTTKVLVADVENELMRGILLNEKFMEVSSTDAGKKAAYSSVRNLKHILYSVYMLSSVELTDEMKTWLDADDSWNEYVPIGEWAGFWYAWKNHVEWDAEERTWKSLPISGPTELLLASIFLMILVTIVCSSTVKKMIVIAYARYVTICMISLIMN